MEEAYSNRELLMDLPTGPGEHDRVCAESKTNGASEERWMKDAQ